MSRFAKLGAILFDVEASWGVISTSFTKRAAIIGQVDCAGLEQAKLDPDFVTMYRNDGNRYIPGPKGGTFKTKHYLSGHGLSQLTSGAITVNDHETLIGRVLGNVLVTGTTGTTFAAGWTKTTGNVAAGGSGVYTAGAGGIVWTGTKGDGRADGQANVIASQAALVTTFLVEMAAIPNAGDIFWTGVNMFPSEDVSHAGAAVISTRFLLQTANQIYRCYGCFPRAFVIDGTDPNKLATIEITWEVSYWTESDGAGGEAFPTAVAVVQDRPTTNSTGSLFFNQVGVATRDATSLIDYRTLRISCELGVEALEGPGGASQQQRYVGATRTRDVWTVEWSENSGVASLTPARAAQWNAELDYHCLITLGTTPGKRVAFYFPRMYFVDGYPVQMEEQSINRIKVKLMAGAGPVTTGPLPLACAKVAYG